jgi:iron complex outermembrane recepter protein
MKISALAAKKNNRKTGLTRPAAALATFILRGRVLLFAATALASVPVMALAVAADPDAALVEIVVTGSHIQRADAETAVNVEVITADEIRNSGQTTVSDYLRTISSTFGNNQNENVTNSFAPGSASVGLRGLSGKDTLVLLNSRRITNYGFFQNLSDSFVDLNVIPLAAIERIEILKSGGSAIYGSDAVAGVINIILKQNSTDKAVEVGGAGTTNGGAFERDANIRVGFGDFASQGYNLYVTGSVYKRDQLLFSQRENTETQDYRNLPDGVLFYSLGTQYKTNNGVPRHPFPSCGNNGLPGVVTTGQQGLACYYNDADQLALAPAAERANLTATGNLRLNDTWTAYSDLFFSNEDTHNNFTPGSLSANSFTIDPATGSATPFSNVLPGNNPASVGGAPTPINYRFQSVGRRDGEVVSNTYRVTLGAKGTLFGWDIDGGYGHSENHVSFEGSHYINANALSAEIADGSYSFLNPLSTPAASAALGVTDTFSSVAKLDTLDVKGSGALFDLPGGPMKMAVGAEVRHESVNDQPGAAAAAGEILSTGETTVVASRTVWAVFSEFDFPILKSLDADVALREEHYSDVGSTSVRPQFTLRYQPVRQFTLRASYAEGFRAPSLAEASQSRSVSIASITDPMDPQGRPSETVGNITGGNENVKPETSKNLDLGIVVSPINNLDLSVDYYRIDVDKVIGPTLPQTIVDDPAAFPGQLLRGPDGTIVYVKSLYTNQFQIHTTGIDFDAAYSIPLAVGSLKFALNATYVDRFDVNDAGVSTNFAGSNGWNYLSPIAGGGPVPHWKGSISGGWGNQDWSGRATYRYLSQYQNSTTTAGFGTTQLNVGSFGVIDLDAEYRGFKNVKFTLSVTNLFNRYPPYDSSSLLFGPTNTPYDATAYDDFGRMVAFHVTFSL